MVEFFSYSGIDSVVTLSESDESKGLFAPADRRKQILLRRLADQNDMY